MYLGKVPAAGKTGRHKRTKGAHYVDWHNRPLSTISRADIQLMHAEVGSMASESAANKALILIRTLYNRAIEWELYDKLNPAIGTKKFKQLSRQRFLHADEMPRFLAAANGEEPVWRDHLLIALLAGGRRSNALSMEWSGVNLDRAVWTIPKEKSKNDEPMHVPLPTQAVDILRARKPEGPAKFVFKSTRSKSGHIEEPSAVLKRVLDRDELTQLAARIAERGVKFEWPLENKKVGKRDHRTVLETMAQSLARARLEAKELEINTAGARITNLHIHDLRRTQGSWQAAGGSSLVIGASLGHKDSSSTQVYARLDLDPVRTSMQGAVDKMFSTTQPAPEVVDIESARRKAG